MRSGLATKGSSVWEFPTLGSNMEFVLLAGYKMWYKAGECQNWFSSLEGFRYSAGSPVLFLNLDLRCFALLNAKVSWMEVFGIFHGELSPGIMFHSTALPVTVTEGAWAISMVSCILVAARMGKQLACLLTESCSRFSANRLNLMIGFICHVLERSRRCLSYRGEGSMDVQEAKLTGGEALYFLYSRGSAKGPWDTQAPQYCCFWTQTSTCVSEKSGFTREGGPVTWEYKCLLSDTYSSPSFLMWHSVNLLKDFRAYWACKQKYY